MSKPKKKPCLEHVPDLENLTVEFDGDDINVYAECVNCSVKAYIEVPYHEDAFVWDDGR